MNGISAAYEAARKKYAEYGVDTDAAIERLKKTEISLHCWQGDDVLGFESPDAVLSGGIMTTGNHPGRARDADELRADMAFVMSLLPGRQRVNLHAIYLESGGKKIDRDEISPEHFENWMQWARELGVNLDFNTSMFSHPKANGYTLASYDKGVRDFWIEHGKRCRTIAAEMGRRQNSPCVINHWMIDGCKEPPVDRARRRELFVESMDGIISEKMPESQILDSIESKLFGIGMESFTAGSAELCFGYAMSRKIMLTYDMGHFHPTESVADKISSALLFVGKLLVHTSRGVRWDSDHVVVKGDDVDLLMQEIVRANALDRVYIALDFFDASIDRIAAWVIGARATQKALLTAMLEPHAMLLEEEMSGDTTWRLALADEQKCMPLGAVWDYFCECEGVPPGSRWIESVKSYGKNVTGAR